MRFKSGNSVFRFLWLSGDEKYFMRFQSDIKFFRRIVDEKHLIRFDSENAGFKFLRLPSRDNLQISHDFTGEFSVTRF